MTCPVGAPDTFGRCHQGGLDFRQGSLPPRAPHARPRNVSQGGAAPGAEPHAQLLDPAWDCSGVLVLPGEVLTTPAPTGQRDQGRIPGES